MHKINVPLNFSILIEVHCEGQQQELKSLDTRHFTNMWRVIWKPQCGSFRAKTSKRSGSQTRSQTRTWCNSINFREIASGSTRDAEFGTSSAKRTLNKCTEFSASCWLVQVALFLLSCYKSHLFGFGNIRKMIILI